jgi:hypothetical protein
MGGSMSKEYMTTISILDSPEGIKPGLTAEARITVNEIHNALVLPVQAVFEYGSKIYAITFQDGKWNKVEVKTGASNDKEVIILDGFKEGDMVVLGAWAHRDKIGLPKLTPDQEKKEQEQEEMTENPEQNKEQNSKQSGERNSKQSGERNREQSGERNREQGGEQNRKQSTEQNISSPKSRNNQSEDQKQPKSEKRNL